MAPYYPTINPQEHNRYSYALNNPLRYTDATGNQAVAQLAATAATLATAGGIAAGVPVAGWIAAAGLFAVAAGVYAESQTGVFSSIWNSAKDSILGFGKQGKSREAYDDHKRGLDNMRRELKDLKERQNRSKSPKERKEIQKDINKTEKDIKGHEKEIGKTWKKGPPQPEREVAVSEDSDDESSEEE